METLVSVVCVYKKLNHRCCNEHMPFWVGDLCFQCIAPETAEEWSQQNGLQFFEVSSVSIPYEHVDNFYWMWNNSLTVHSYEILALDDQLTQFCYLGAQICVCVYVYVPQHGRSFVQWFVIAHAKEGCSLIADWSWSLVYAIAPNFIHEVPCLNCCIARWLATDASRAWCRCTVQLHRCQMVSCIRR